MKTIFTLISLPFFLFSQNLDVNNPLRFLSLGDSYTIGQSVAVNERWPVQLKDSLVLRGIVVDTLAIIATTGWRTDDLLNAITNKNLANKNFNLVSVLIGVNNQFQGKPFSQYQSEFKQLIDSALLYAGGDSKKVFVVSIPDYAFTPFGQQSPNPSLISSELDQYNAYNKHIADSLNIRYFDITPISRQGLNNSSYVANDGLHPSGAQYTQWVKLMLGEIDVLITELSTVKLDDPFHFTVAPNPAKEIIRVSLNERDIVNSTVMIHDFMGREVKTYRPDTHSFTILIDDLADGIYHLTVNSSGRSASEKIIIAH